MTVGLEKFVETFEMTAIDDKEDYAKTIEAKLGGEFSWYSKLGEGFKKKAKGYVEFDSTFQREKFQYAVEETLKKLCTEYKLSLVLIIAGGRVDFEVWKEK